MIHRTKPIKHKVKQHHREDGGVFVHSYQRGSGVRKETPKLVGMRTTGKPDDTSHGGFEIKIRYADSGGKVGVVRGETYKVGLSRGLGLADRQVRQITLRKMEPWSTEVKN